MRSVLHAIGGFHVTSSPPCWWTVNKRSLTSSLCLSTSICSFHYCYLCLPRLHENHLLNWVYNACTQKSIVVDICHSCWKVVFHRGDFYNISELMLKDNRKKRMAKRSCVTNMTGSLLMRFVVIFTYVNVVWSFTKRPV